MTRRHYYAHTREGAPRDEWEPLEQHLARVGDLAQEFAAAFGAGQWGTLAGLWHDIGKYSDAFQHYLEAATAANDDEHVADVVGRVDHSTAGAQHAERIGPLGHILAYVIAGHHAGLPDDVGGMSGLAERLRKHVEPYDAAPPDLLGHTLPHPPHLHSVGDRKRGAFAVAFFTRMLFSCLVDADFLATEEFMAPERALARPREAATLGHLQRRLDASLDILQATAADTAVNRVRREVLTLCREKASCPRGFFSLHVPTGGGKTLSSLAFALRHGATHCLRRVIYAIPFTSIIEQTANVFRHALGDLQDEVLEHHSNIEPDDPRRQTERSRLAAENFDAPLIVTTNVQLFESLFASRSSRCRKLHRLAGSIIVLDEAQALPAALLAPTLGALDELVRNYGTTVVLCTATQPAVEWRDNFPIGLNNVMPIIEDPRALHDVLRRTEVRRSGSMSDADVVARLRETPQVLCIVNSRQHAAAIFKLLADPDALHLSANLCGAHRSEVIAEIGRRLALTEGGPCRVISTQVVEAGVDVDFPIVYRAVAGLDSIAQAAGRCNREGRLKDSGGRPCPGPVVVFDYDEDEHRSPPLIRRAGGYFREIAPDHEADLLAPQAIDAYFRLQYWERGGDGGRGWDQGHGGGSVMRCFGGEDGDPSHHQFREAADRYRLIDNAQTSVLVPYKEAGRRLIQTLEAMREPPDGAFDRTTQRYVVGVWQRDLQRLLRNNVLGEQHGRYYLRRDSAYDARLGLLPDVTEVDII